MTWGDPRPAPEAAGALAAELPPPVTEVGAIGWLRHNLFGSRTSALATVALAVALGWAGFALARWAFADARWGVVTANLRLFLVGVFPPDQLWRVWLSLLLLSVLTGLSAGTYGGASRTFARWLAAGLVVVAVLGLASGLGGVAMGAVVACAAVILVGAVVATRRAIPRRTLWVAWLASFPVTMLLLGGIGRGGLLPSVDPGVMGGLLLTFLLATVSIVLSFPLGVLLALGRRSRLPVVRLLCTAYIEVVRGVPLITIIFMADLLLPLALPGDVRIERVIRAMGGFTLFTAAYLAENVRGGLQGVAHGQSEAAAALGLNGFQTMWFIVLPQALRSVIPANVGLFISLLKDTTLVVIVGLLELLGIGRAVLAQPAWLGAQFEVYLFVGGIFFVLCATLARASYRLERTLGVGER